MNLSKCRIDRVEAQLLRVHPYAQRAMVPITLKKISARFDPGAVGVLHAVDLKIHGTQALWVVDGQTRLRGILDQGMGSMKVPVMVHLDITDDAGAAKLFLALNTRAPVSPFDKFSIEVTAKDPCAVGVVGILSEYGIKTSRTTGDGCVCCVTALKKVQAAGVLAPTLETIIAAWGKTAAALEGKIIEGVGLVHQTYGDAIDRPALNKKLAKFNGGAPGLIGKAKMFLDIRRGSLSRCVASVIVSTYNSGRHVGQLGAL